MATTKKHRSSRRARLHPDEDVIPLHALPKELPPTTTFHRDAFPVSIMLAIVNPRSLLIKSCDLSRSQRTAVEKRPTLVCETSTTIFISVAQSFDDILDQLATHAQTSFGINLSDRSRWGCVMLACCEDTSEMVDKDNAAFFISAASQGGWGWKFYVAELERSPRGIWESRTSIRAA
ncbi:hypothetical protein CLAFUW4_03859 [Fulvia fulva]|uniref:Uncharacterized protein n=1 Tax=Passalora fulva TaxID=5499 RepID=A0A9Q8P587_PASFU|nr:uncharacterized protein CLAFUR5_03831 [Fulvia fulva]KAK4632514.1 hypothetical protein CLAFUR0_03846 [Fulvia fulva]UJO13753.1 hypothetical protein CLAFUR5_03831 [Fulvia fulva]WPV11518.1 hypothetical protein CLAFUW4_03859 [Fulvia fulva]